jgi:hypothetical protein
LIEYIDGILLPEEAQPVQAHLAGCPACRKEEDVLLAVLSEARAPLPEPGELFWINFLPGVRAKIALRPEPWFATLFKPAVGWGSLSLATLMVLAGILVWRMAPVREGAPSYSRATADYLSYETGYPLDEHLAQAVETSKDETEARHKVFEKLSPQGEQGQGSQVQPGDAEDLDNLLEGLTPEQKKALDQIIKELEQKANVKEA